LNQPDISRPVAGCPSPGSEIYTQILLVEDNDDYAELIQQTLLQSKAASVQVHRELRLDDALGLIEYEHYDIMLLDLSLPDGYGAFTVGSACALARCSDTSGSVAVAFLRYDNFETLSCLFGKRICDEMDRCASILLSEPTLVSERVVPLRPGTFAAVLEGVRSEESIARVCAHLLRTLSDVEMVDDKGFKIDGITASIGVAVAPWDGATPNELIDNASAAQQKAAREGGSRYGFYRPKDYL